MSEEPTEVGRPPANLAAGIVKAVRPRQWVKNVLVLAAPLAAGSVTEGSVLVPVALEKWESDELVWIRPH